MPMGKFLLFLSIYIVSAGATVAQDIPIYRNFYLNPSILNPAFNGASYYTSVNLFYREQWIGVDDAPESFGLNLQFPTRKKLFFGFDVYSEEAVLLRNSSAVITAGYALPIAKNQELRFAISGGIGYNKLDLTEEELSTADPTIIAAMDNNYYVDGRFGLSYRYNHFEIGASLPRLFEANSFTEDEFKEVEFSEFDYRILFGSYRFYPSPDFSIKPQVLFIQNGAIDEFGGALGLHYKDLFWVGGTYLNSAGLFAGVQFNNISIQYNYEIASLPGDVFDNASHGIQLSIKLGKSKRSDGAVIKGDNIASSHADDLEEDNTTIEEEVIEKGPGTEPVTEISSDGGGEETDYSEPDLSTETSKKPAYPEEVASSPADNETSEEWSGKVDIDDPNFDSGLMSRKGGLTMKPGYYVVIGVFKIMENAIHLSRKSMGKGYVSDMVINPENNYYYVFVYYDDSNREKATAARKAFRKKFKGAWLLEIE